MKRGFATAIALLIGLSLLGPTATGHPFHLEVSNEVVNSPERVESSNWIAQSFLTPANFFVSRVSVYAADIGTNDSLTASIRPSALNFPASTILTQGATDGPATDGWLDIDLNPYVPLNAGTSYWIVASSPAAGGEGYNWWNSGTDVAYLDGTGATSSDGVVWSPRGRDFTFRVYGFVQPDLSFSASVDNTTVRVGGLVVLQVGIQNAGPGSAEAAWVNVTLPPDLAYVADDAAAAGGTRSGTYSFAFTTLDPGSRSFNVTLQAAAGVVNGTNVIVRVEIQPTDHNGVLLTPFIRNIGIEIVGGPNAPVRPAETPWWWLVPILLAFVGGSLLVWRRRRRQVIIDDVFVGDKNGVLLAHRSASLVQYADEDILVGMFKAIQDFVKDTFSRGVEEEFHALEFGQRRVLIERGRGHFIAVVYRGEDREALKDRVRKLSRAIDESFGDVIESWNGEVDAVQGITLLLPRIWKPRA